jgi:tetratricopeptide (TPR) repeat protein
METQRNILRRLAFFAAWLSFAALSWPVSAQNQEWTPARDPVIQAVMQAIRDQRLADAERILTNAIATAERTAPNPQLSFYLDDLAGLYDRKGDRTQALNLAQRALESDRSLYGSTDIRLAPRMTVAAGFLRMQKRSGEAEQLLLRAVDLVRQSSNPGALESDTKSGVLGALASFYEFEGRYGEAVQWYEDALKICGNPKGICDLLRGQLARLYQRQGRLADAERLPSGPLPIELARIEGQAEQSMRNGLYVQAEINYRNAIQWIEQNPKARMDGQLSFEWVEMGRALERQGRDGPAEDAYKKAFEVQEARVNPRIPQTAFGFPTSPLVDLYRRQGRVAEAEAVIQRAVGIQEKILGPEHASVAETLMQLARLFAEEGKNNKARYSDAATVYERILKIQEKNFGADHAQLRPALFGYADVLRKDHQDSKAAEVQARLDKIRTR